MSRKPLTVDDYPLAEKHPQMVLGQRGKSLDEITLDAVVSGVVGMEDLRITPQALRQQAEIAEDANRETLGANFRRAAEMAAVPQATIMEIYELLRPGRVGEKQVLIDVAARLRAEFGATEMAAFVEEAAEVYQRRGLFRFRY